MKKIFIHILGGAGRTYLIDALLHCHVKCLFMDWKVKYPNEKMQLLDPWKPLENNNEYAFDKSTKFFDAHAPFLTALTEQTTFSFRHDILVYICSTDFAEHEMLKNFDEIYYVGRDIRDIYSTQRYHVLEEYINNGLKRLSRGLFLFCAHYSFEDGFDVQMLQFLCYKMMSEKAEKKIKFIRFEDIKYSSDSFHNLLCQILDCRINTDVIYKKVNSLDTRPFQMKNGQKNTWQHLPADFVAFFEEKAYIFNKFFNYDIKYIFSSDMYNKYRYTLEFTDRVEDEYKTFFQYSIDDNSVNQLIEKFISAIHEYETLHMAPQYIVTTLYFQYNFLHFNKNLKNFHYSQNLYNMAKNFIQEKLHNMIAKAHEDIVGINPR